MPSIKPVSDLRNYNEVLREVEDGAPVFLTKNGRGKFVIIDINEYERMNAELKLIGELEKGERSARENGWTRFSEIEKEFDGDERN